MSLQLNNALTDLENKLKELSKKSQAHYLQTNMNLNAILNKAERNKVKFDHNSKHNKEFTLEEIDFQIIIEDFETTPEFELYIQKVQLEDEQQYLSKLQNMKQEQLNKIVPVLSQEESQEEKMIIKKIPIDQSLYVEQENQHLKDEPQDKELLGDGSKIEEPQIEDKMVKETEDKEQNDEGLKDKIKSQNEDGIDNNKVSLSQIAPRKQREIEFYLISDHFKVEMTKDACSNLFTLTFEMLKNQPKLEMTLFHGQEKLGKFILNFQEVILKSYECDQSQISIRVEDISRLNLFKSFTLQFKFIEYSKDLIGRCHNFLANNND